MSRVPLGLISAALCLTLSGCGGVVAGVDADKGAASEQNGQRSAGGQPADQVQQGRTAKVAKMPVPTPTPEPTKAPLVVADLLGDDGRLSVLLLGSDRRKDIAGERTDAIIVATLDPDSGDVAMVSMPRDTVDVPIGPGKTYPGRINALYGEFRGSSNERKALKKTKQAFEYAFDTEIDYYALVDFDGLVRLVDSIGGVEVKLDKPLIDPTMHIGKKGLRLKAGTQSLDGKMALAFSRSRHSTDDYDRSRRQQQVVAAAIDKVRDGSPAAVPALLELISKKVVTDIPMRAAPALLKLADDAKLGNPKSMVLAPSRWARPASQLYTIAPRVVEIRKMFDRVFRPLN